MYPALKARGRHHPEGAEASSAIHGPVPAMRLQPQARGTYQISTTPGYWG